MRSFIMLCLFLLLVVPDAGATPLNDDERRENLQIVSDVLGETRQIIVHLPDDYQDNPDRRYSVLYLTDAEWQFDLIAATLDYHAEWGRIPRHIVVGLFNPERNADLVPVADPGYPGSGDGDAYLRHVSEDVLPLIDERYRTNDIRILFGHSFGGVMVLNQLLTDSEVFDGYIALGASTWVSDRVLFDRLQTADLDFGGAALYTAVGETDGGATVPDGELFAERLAAMEPQSLDWVFEIRPGENHFTNVPEGLHRAISFLYPFAHQETELVERARQGGADAVRAWFAQEESRLDWRFHPQTMELSLAGFTLGSEGEVGAAMTVFDELQRRFPENVEVVAIRANTLGAARQYAAAITEIDRAIEMAEESGHPASRVAAFRAFRGRLVSRMEAPAEDRN
ncbi:alpha/beta hydrolase-fold protein [Hyphobacterium sp.]|uniref:alpha/beta hydrolase-fold protein n=1 Tax=Hyphobacterium sp. TaxID=2004662 RepID=UPI0037484068